MTLAIYTALAIKSREATEAGLTPKSVVLFGGFKMMRNGGATNLRFQLACGNVLILTIMQKR